MICHKKKSFVIFLYFLFINIKGVDCRQQTNNKQNNQSIGFRFFLSSIGPSVEKQIIRWFRLLGVLVTEYGTGISYMNWEHRSICWSPGRRPLSVSFSISNIYSDFDTKCLLSIISNIYSEKSKPFVSIFSRDDQISPSQHTIGSSVSQLLSKYMPTEYQWKAINQLFVIEDMIGFEGTSDLS